MKTLLLSAIAILSLNAFATPDAVQTGAWPYTCYVYTTGSQPSDVKNLAYGKFTLELTEKTSMVTIYKEGKLEFKAWLAHFSGDNPGKSFNLLQLGLFKNGKFFAGAQSDFTEEPPKTLQAFMPNITKNKRPPTTGISCRRD